MRFTQEHETRVVVAGQEYHAQTCQPVKHRPARLGTCKGCTFVGPRGCNAPLPPTAMPCLGTERADRTAIIWVLA